MIINIVRKKKKEIRRETEGYYKSDIKKILKFILSHDHAVKSVIVFTFQSYKQRSYSRR